MKYFIAYILFKSFQMLIITNRKPLLNMSVFSVGLFSGIVKVKRREKKRHVLNWQFVCQQSTQRCDVCVKWELVWVGLPCFVQCFGFCSSSNELWKPWLQLECLIATANWEGELVNGEKARGDDVFLSKGQDRPDDRLGKIKLHYPSHNHHIRISLFKWTAFLGLDTHVFSSYFFFNKDIIYDCLDFSIDVI